MSTHRTGYARTTRRWQLVTVLAAIVGAVFLLLGVLGFIPGITTDYDQLQFAGHESEAMLFGIFQVSILHNLVHVLAGIVGLALASAARTAFGYLLIGGLLSLLLWFYGVRVVKDSAANFLPVNTGDDWLHFGLGVGMIVLGLIGWGVRDRGRAVTR